MANEKLVIKKGLLKNLPEAKVPGTIYITTDEHGMYVDTAEDTRIRIGDFLEFDSMEALSTLIEEDASKLSTTALYYLKDENVLCKYDGEAFKQINKDTGATAAEATGDKNFTLTYDGTGRKITLTIISPVALKSDLGDLGDKATVKAYVDNAISQISGEEGTLKEQVDALKEQVGTLDPEGATSTGLEKKVDDLKKLVGETPVEEQISSAIEELNLDTTYVTKQELTSSQQTQDEKITALENTVGKSMEGGSTGLVKKVEDLETKVGSSDPEGSGLLKDVDDLKEKVGGSSVQDQISSAITGLNLDTTYATKSELETEKGRIGTLETNDKAQDTKIQTIEKSIKGLSGAMHFKNAVQTDPTAEDFQKEGYVVGDVVTWGDKEYVFTQDQKFVEFGDISPVSQRVTTLEGRVDALDSFKTTAQSDIEELKTFKNITVPGTYATKDNLEQAKTDLIGNEETIEADTIQGAVKEANTYTDNKISGLDISVKWGEF